MPSLIDGGHYVSDLVGIAGETLTLGDGPATFVGIRELDNGRIAAYTGDGSGHFDESHAMWYVSLEDYQAYFVEPSGWLKTQDNTIYDISRCTPGYDGTQLYWAVLIARRRTMG